MTQTELKEFIFRQLGSDAHDIEISEASFIDIANRAYIEHSDYSSECIERKVVQVFSTDTTIDENGDTIVNPSLTFQLPVETVSVLEVHQLDGVKINGSGNIDTMFDDANLYVPVSMKSLITGVNGGNMTTVFEQKNRLDQLNALSNFGVDTLAYDYNKLTRKINILTDDVITNTLAVLINSRIPIENVSDDYNFQLLLLSKMWRFWATIIGAKYDVSQSSIMGNGLHLNVPYMIERADTLLDEYKQRIEDNELNSAIPIYIAGK